MKTHAKQPANSRPAQTKANNQASEKSILQAYKQNVAQREALDEEEPTQTKSKDTAQLEGMEEDEEPAQRKANDTGLPDNLKSGVENLSGHSMDDVKVHYNSAKPAELQAHAYAQGSDIHVAPGQEKHLPHEAWHVAQQKQGRVKPTRQLKGTTPINDDDGLENEADVMGAKAAQMQPEEEKTQLKSKSAGSVFQFKNSRTPNWLHEYQSRPQIHQQGIAGYITHVEQGQGGAGAQQGFHAYQTNGAAPGSVRIVEQANVGHDSVGQVLWYNPNQAGGNGTAGQRIHVKNSTTFPKRLSASKGGTTGVRAIMKAAAANDGFAEITRAAGLDGRVNHLNPTVYPVGAPLRPSGAQFDSNGVYYQVI